MRTESRQVASPLARSVSSPDAAMNSVNVSHVGVRVGVKHHATKNIVLGQGRPWPSTRVSGLTDQRLDERMPARTRADTFARATATTAKKMRFPVFFMRIQLLRHPGKLGDTHRSD